MVRKSNRDCKGSGRPVTSQITASAIQLFGSGITVVLDREAASELKNTEHYMHRENLKNAFQPSE